MAASCFFHVVLTFSNIFPIFDFSNSKSGMAIKKSGISRAIEFFGSQVAMAARLAMATGAPINQGYISKWLAAGYVPRKRAPLVAELTGVDVKDLLRTSPRKPRSNGQKPATNEH